MMCCAREMPLLHLRSLCCMDVVTKVHVNLIMISTFSVVDCGTQWVTKLNLPSFRKREVSNIYRIICDHIFCLVLDRNLAFFLCKRKCFIQQKQKLCFTDVCKDGNIFRHYHMMFISIPTFEIFPSIQTLPFANLWKVLDF